MTKVILYTLSIRNIVTKNVRGLYGHVTPNVIDQYWEAYAERLEEDEELVISVYQHIEVNDDDSHIEVNEDEMDTHLEPTYFERMNAELYD